MHLKLLVTLQALRFQPRNAGKQLGPVVKEKFRRIWRDIKALGKLLGGVICPGLKQKFDERFGKGGMLCAEVVDEVVLPCPENDLRICLSNS